MSKVGARSVDNRRANQGVIDSMEATRKANEKKKAQLEIEEARDAGKITNEEANKRAAKAEADQLKNKEWESRQEASKNYYKDKNRLGRILNDDGGLLVPREQYVFGSEAVSKENREQFKEKQKELRNTARDYVRSKGKKNAMPVAFGDSALARAYDELGYIIENKSGKDQKESYNRIISEMKEDLLYQYFPEEAKKMEQQRVDKANKEAVFRTDDSFQDSKEENKTKKAGGSLMVPREGYAIGDMVEEPMEIPVEEDMPVDTYPNIPPEEMAAAEASQLPDEEMEDEFIDFILDESLNPEEQTYLMNSLEADPQLSVIFDKLIGTASEFSGAGEVEGPGTGVSDSIPARLSDGEFVMTRKATDAIGPDNLQMLMDDAEMAYDYDGGRELQMAFGGVVEGDDEIEDTKDSLSQTDEEIRKVMIGANKMPSVR